jgi:hypothetical protein
MLMLRSWPLELACCQVANWWQASSKNPLPQINDQPRFFYHLDKLAGREQTLPPLDTSAPDASNPRMVRVCRQTMGW